MHKFLLSFGACLAIAVVVAILYPHESRARSASKGLQQQAAVLPAGEWQSLFNGRDLEGWQHLGGGKVFIQDGLLTLEHDHERTPGYLVSNVKARDFEAHLVCKIITGDSGFFFRSRLVKGNPREVTGPQVQLNVEPGRGLGGIFELHGRAWIQKPARELEAELLRGLDWIECDLRVHGEQILAMINGRQVVDLLDGGSENEFREPGFFALQIHGGGYLKVLFREITVRGLESE
jgi:hypothetical protein